MKVKIELYATLRDKYGAKEIVVECDGSIKNLIERASKLLDEDFLMRCTIAKGISLEKIEFPQ